MTRRALLGFLAAAAVDPERLIWEPGRKLISIPAPAAASMPTISWASWDAAPRLSWAGYSFYQDEILFTVQDDDGPDEPQGRLVKAMSDAGECVTLRAMRVIPV